MTCYRNAIAFIYIAVHCLCCNGLELIIAFTHLRRDNTETNFKIGQSILAEPQRAKLTVCLSSLKSDYNLLIGFIYIGYTVEAMGCLHFLDISPLVLHFRI